MVERQQNPFNQPYITEAIGSAADLLAHYSYRPFHVLEDIKRAGNVILSGRKGVGKTMILRLFDRELVAEVYRNAPRGSEARKHAPVATVGVYVNLASPVLRIRDFGGNELSTHGWLRAFADYVNYLILQGAVRGLVALSSNADWRAASGWTGAAFDQRSDVIEAVATALRIESAVFEPIHGLADFDKLIRERLQGWARFLNREESSPPSTPLSLGVPVFALAAAVKEVCPRFRVFVLVDQYEFLHSARKTVELRPVFNQAMYEASRGGTCVEFKIGSRPYSHGDLRLLADAGTLEEGREVNILDLDARADGYFPLMAAELVLKRMEQSGYRVAGAEPLQFVNELVPSLTCMEEADRYVKNAVSATRSLAPFEDAWLSLGVSPEDSARVVRIITEGDTPPMISTLAALWVTKWLARGRSRIPSWVQTGGESASQGLSDKLGTIAAAFRQALVRRYEMGTARARKEGGATRAADDFISDWEPAALFRIASSYKNQRKYYAGFETLVRVSSNVAATFIQLMKRAWEVSSARSDFSPHSIPPDVQSEAVHSESEAWFFTIAREYEHGVLQERLVRSLGLSLKKMQMDPLATVPAPNGFSITHSTEENIPALNEDPRANPRALLRLLVSWGLLEQDEHQDKTSGRPRRQKYYLNRILCPFFGLTELHIKDPFYVNDVDEFIRSLTTNITPSEMSSTPNRGAQQNLF